VKTEVRLGHLPFRPYVSLRFDGDTRGTTREIVPQYLSQSAFILGVGLATNTWHHAMLWAEPERRPVIWPTTREAPGSRLPRWRLGIAALRPLLGAEAPGWFAETNGDGVFVSRFQNDFLVLLAESLRLHAPALGAFAPSSSPPGTSRLIHSAYWANFVELGPGLRLRWTACARAGLLGPPAARRLHP